MSACRLRLTLPRSRQENEVGDVALAHVARALEAVNAQEIDAQLHGRRCVPDRRALVDHDAARGLEAPDDGARAVARRLDDADPGVDDGRRVGVVIGWVERREQRDVHAEGVWGQGAAFRDLGC